MSLNSVVLSSKYSRLLRDLLNLYLEIQWIALEIWWDVCKMLLKIKLPCK